MQLPQIRLESQFAKIGISQLAGKQEIRQPHAELTIKQPKADLTMSTTPSKLTIDQTQAWEDMDLMSIVRRTELFAQEGKSGAAEGTGRRAEEGTALMKIEHGGSPIVQQALINGHPQMKTLGVKYIPSHFSVKIDYQPSEIHINAQANKPIIEARANKAEHNYNPSQVDIRIEQYNKLDIDFTNLFSESI